MSRARSSKAFEAVGPAGEAALRADLLALAHWFDRNGGGPVALPARHLEVLAARA